MLSFRRWLIGGNLKLFISLVFVGIGGAFSPSRFNVAPYRASIEDSTFYKRRSFARYLGGTDREASLPRHFINGDKNDPSSDHSVHHNFLTPYEIVYPSFFGASFNGYDRRLSIPGAIRLLTKALQELGEQNRPILVEAQQKNRILRIEQKLSSNSDVLGWFDAQSTRINEASWLFYFQNQQKTFETAALGALLTVETEQMWTPEVWAALPRNAQLYGGARFDPGSKTSDEWKEFGNSAWTLPAVELRSFLDPKTNSTISTLAVHVVPKRGVDATVDILQRIDGSSSPNMPPTTIPPVLSRSSNYGSVGGQELYESSVDKALEQLADPSCSLEKVVLARRLSMEVERPDFTARSLLRRWKYGGGVGGHVFYVRPESLIPNLAAKEFFGCTPERLFSVSSDIVQSEALAGTRPRGSTPEADAALLQELVDDPKDRNENRLTGSYIEDVFDYLSRDGLIDWERPNADSGSFFVRRLLHLQHICQSYSAGLTSHVGQAAKELLSRLHPTPAVCGVPFVESRDFIRSYESIGFDRGWYAGPVGRIGPDSVEIVVAIRSGLVDTKILDRKSRKSILTYAGAGIVPGSSLQGEWAETNYKFSVVSSCFPQSPIVLTATPTPNAAWATAFVEELIRNGVTQFYVCPGSRSTPLVVAISKLVRLHVGIVKATSVHDERAAAFRALGFGRGTGRPAAIVTSSGTAVSNLYPAVVEASMDGVPMVLLTADRPYEARHSGANQCIDQVKHFAETYIRWFRDVLPPTDDVPVSVALSDAGHAVTVALEQRGPVHINVQFRENLAPDAGPIRGDDRIGSEITFDGARFTEGPGIDRWLTRGASFSDTLLSSMTPFGASLDVARLIHSSKRGIVCVGNLRGTVDFCSGQEIEAIAEFAESIGFPLIAGVQSAQLRFQSTAVVPFAEHVLKCELVQENVQPDLIIQIGSPLVSTEVASLIAAATKREKDPANHVLIHPHKQNERADPLFSLSHRVNSEIEPFLNRVLECMEQDHFKSSSELTSLVLLGRELQLEMKDIIVSASRTVSGAQDSLSEPEIILALSESESDSDQSLFISNSMPVRDCESFLYPFQPKLASVATGPKHIGTNRGASGIDGILSSSLGYSEATQLPTTVLIGDLATLHDLSSMHSISSQLSGPSSASMAIKNPLTCLIVNNDGGGIFSFLPIAHHGDDVGFDEFFGTPTNSFSFEKGADAFGIELETVSDYESLVAAYSKAKSSHRHRLIEAKVLPREHNVAIHREISKRVDIFLRGILEEKLEPSSSLPIDIYGLQPTEEILPERRTLVLLHGWMGDRSEWAAVADSLKLMLPEWTIVAIDLPGHGSSPSMCSSVKQTLRDRLRLNDSVNFDTRTLATEVLSALKNFHGVTQIDAIAGYSLGGRVALALHEIDRASDTPLLHDRTKIVLVSANPGTSVSPSGVQSTRKIWEPAEGNRDFDEDASKRISSDKALASTILSMWDKSVVGQKSDSANTILWSSFLSAWYTNPIWGDLLGKKDVAIAMNLRRAASLARRGRDIAYVLEGCTPPLNAVQRGASLPTIMITGELDKKYSSIGQEWSEATGLQAYRIPNAGHALLVDAPEEVTAILSDFLKTEVNCSPDSEFLDARFNSTDPIPLVLSTSDNKSGRESSIEQPTDTKGTLKQETPLLVEFSRLKFLPFSLGLSGKSQGIAGIGWGSSASAADTTQTRSGFIIELSTSTTRPGAIGEVSPLAGLHEETRAQVEQQLCDLQQFLLEASDETILGDAYNILGLRGHLTSALDNLARSAGIDRLHPSVRFGLETAALNLASQNVNLPLNSALERFRLASTSESSKPTAGLPLNGLIPRGELGYFQAQFPSIKVKIGHGSLRKDIESISGLLKADRSPAATIRADANRAWDFDKALEFASDMQRFRVNAVDRIEYIEEPLKKVGSNQTAWSLDNQVDKLEEWYRHTGIHFALDESLFDAFHDSKGSFIALKTSLDRLFLDSNRGCAAFVLKPALLGVEFSVRLASLARETYGIGAVFSSSFDSGVGLAYSAMLADFTDKIPSAAPKYAHGLGTYQQLDADTISPSFGSYVDQNGIANVASLCRALNGLLLEEISGAGIGLSSPEESTVIQDTREEEYEASTTTHSAGNQINIVVSLPLPFPATTASSRFTDLPQQPRWSPWITSVEFEGNESRWMVNVRGISLTWKAVSEVLTDPWPGIRWESVSGVKNSGTVQFKDTPDGSCQMNVEMNIVPPRILRPLFRGTSGFIEDFMRNKLLKWSLEMFRDVVKADLALERGDVELGDALFGAVEGKANAIEATLNTTSLNPNV